MPTPIPFIEDDLNDTFFADSHTDRGSIPWIRGSPDLWSQAAQQRAKQLFSLIRTENFIQSLWNDAFLAYYRQFLLLLCQMILHRILDNRRPSAVFDRKDRLLLFHINCLISSLDIRDNVLKMSRSKKQPHQWLQHI